MRGALVDALEDHLAITDNVGSDDGKGDQRGNLQFKCYSNGKSKSDQHHSRLKGGSASLRIIPCETSTSASRTLRSRPRILPDILFSASLHQAEDLSLVQSCHHIRSTTYSSTYTHTVPQNLFHPEIPCCELLL